MMTSYDSHTFRFFVTLRTTYADGRVVEEGGYDIIARSEVQALHAAYNWYCRGPFANGIINREVISVE